MRRGITCILILAALASPPRASAQDEQRLELYLETGHTESISSIAFPADGKTIVSASYDGTVKLWDVASGMELQTVNAPVCTFSPDNKTAALQDWTNKAIILWDVQSWRARHTLRWEEGYSTNAFSPGGGQLAAWNNTTLRLWDVASGRELYTLKAQTALSSQVFFSPDWATIAWPGYNQIALIDAASGREFHTLRNDVGAIFFTFAQDGKTLVAWGNTGLRVWDVPSGRELNALQGGVVSSPTFSPDGRAFAFTHSAFDSSAVYLWDIGDGKPLRKVKEHVHSLYTYFFPPAFSPDGKTLLISFAAGIGKIGGSTFVDVASGQELDFLKEPASLAVSPNWKHVVSWAAGGDTARLWEAGSWRQLATIKAGFNFTGVAFSPDGRLVQLWNDEASTLWSVATKQEVQRQKARVGNYPRFTVSPNAKTVAAVGQDVMLWDAASERQLPTLKGEAFPVRSLALAPSGKVLVTWNLQGTVIKVWDVASGHVTRTLRLEDRAAIERPRTWESNPSMFMPARFSAGLILGIPPSPPFGTEPRAPLANGSSGKLLHAPAPPPARLLQVPAAGLLSPDEKTFASLATAGAVTLWSVESGKKLCTLNAGAKSFGSVVFSSDSRTIATVSEKVILLWDAESGSLRRTLDGYETGHPVYSPDGRLIAAWGADHAPKVWDTTSGRELHITDGHKSSINALAFAPDSKTLASAGSDRTIKLWDVTSGQKLRTLAGHDGAVSSVAFGSDHKVLASAGSDGTTRLWDTASGRVLKTFRSDDPKTMGAVFASVPDLYLKDTAAQMQLTRDGKLGVRLGENGRVNLINAKTGMLLAGLVALGDEEWVITTPEGRFDTNKSLDRIEGLHWVVNDEILTPLPLDVFMRQYYEPGLLRRVLNGERFKPLPSIASINRVLPGVEIKEIKPSADDADSVDVTVEAANRIEDVRVSAADKTKVRRMSSGVFDVRLFRDGQLVGSSTPDESLRATFRRYKGYDEELAVWREAHKTNRVGGRETFTFKVKLPASSQGKQIEFSAYAFNSDRAKSKTALANFSAPAKAALKIAPRRAYVVTFGVSTYDNPEWDLRFAGDDARAISQTVSASLRAQQEIGDVVEIPLISGRENINGLAGERRDATKGNIQTVLELLAGKAPPDERLKTLERAVGTGVLRRVQQATPDDIVLIAFSSHGYADAGGIFYIVPADIGRDSRKRVTTQLLSRSISSDELSLWLRGVDAGEMVMIVDACYAASAVEGSEFKPGPMGSRGLGQLAFDKGMRILAATQADNVAMENTFIKQGLLTYALIQEGIEARRADYRPRDKIITLSEWLAYSVERVPKLYEEVRLGGPAWLGARTEQQMKFVIAARGGKSFSKELEEVTAAGKTQQPSLFDFTRKKGEVILSVLR